MYETYLDDSGTSAQSPIAIAACYVSTKTGWDRFVKEWDIARYEEGFDFFHMAEFVAPREQMNTVHDQLKPMFGLDGGGFSFQSKKQSKPLQAADILAWQMHNYMRKIYPNDETQADVSNKLHKGFAKLRMGQEMRLGFYTQSSLNAWLEKLLTFEAEHVVVP